MNNLDLTNIEDLVMVSDTAGVTQPTLMYINLEKSIDTTYEDKKELRDLKVGELIYNENNSEEIEELETKLEINGNWDNSGTQMTTISSSIKNINVKLNKSIKISSDEYLSNLVENLRKDILDDIYKISSNNHILTSQIIPDLTLTDEEASDEFITSRKILGKMLACGNYIAIEGRIGTANTVIMNRKLANIIQSNASQYVSSINNHNGHKAFSIYGMDVIIDNRLGDKIVVFRKAIDMTQISNNLLFFHYYRNGLLKYKIQQIEDCDSNYIEFHINGLYI